MLLRWLVIIPAAAAPVFDPADGSGARKRPNSRRRARLGACASDVRSSHCVGDMRSRRGADEPSLWATGCQRSTILWPRGARSQVLQSALAKLDPVTVVLTCLLDHPVGAQCMQTGYNAHSAGCMGSCNALARQNQTTVHHMGCRLRYRQCLVRTSCNALTAMVANVGVKAQAVVFALPSGTRADIHTGLTVAVRNALMHTAFGMDGQGRVGRCCPCVCAHVA
jgi:hypothetical protein